MNRLLRYLFVGMFVVVVIAFAGKLAVAFDTSGGKWPQPEGLGSHITLTYSYQNMFDGALKMPNGHPLPANIIRSSIEEALGLWASVVPIDFIEVPDDGLEYYQGATQYGRIRFRHIYINGPDPPVGSPIAKAQAYYPYSGEPYAGDVEFDHSDPWQPSGTLPTPDILGATIHELGHALGLGHSNDPNANLYWIFHRFQGPGTGRLFEDDIAGIQTIYGPGVGSITTLAVPEPTTIALVALSLLASPAGLRRRRISR